MRLRNDESGQVIVIVMIVLVLVSLFVPVLVNMVRQEALWTIGEKKSTLAFNLAEAGIDRGIWKLKSSTATFKSAADGVVIPDYDFDKTFDDIPGGYYRVRFATTTSKNEIVIYSEGKDSDSRQVRAIKCVVRNQTIPGAIISKGVISLQHAFEVHWGPVMAHGNIDITDASAAHEYYPRKFSRQVVTSNTKGYPRDLNGLDPPNTDNAEWWSDYPVPDLPVLDFAALRSSAAATGTLNVYGCSRMKSYSGPRWWQGTTWWGGTYNLSTCGVGGGNHDGEPHFQNPYRHPDAQKGYVWFWDGDVVFTGGTGDDGCGIVGTVIVMGNFTNRSGDNLYSSMPEVGLAQVPTEAWREYTKLTKTTGDTTLQNEYPADDGYQKNRATFNLGGETWSGGPAYYNTDVGIKGFLYVGGDFYVRGIMDIYGAIWVVGDTYIHSSISSERVVVFFDENLSLPSLNVILIRRSWEEVKPSTTPWV